MTNKTLYLTVVLFLFVGILSAVLVHYSDKDSRDASDYRLISEQIGKLSNQIAVLDNKLNNLNNIVLESHEQKGPGILSNTDYVPLSDIENDTVPDDTSGAPEEQDVELTEQQQQLYDSLVQRIESADYGGFSMNDLLSQMKPIPEAHQKNLMKKVTQMVNSGKLDPQKFVEGKY